MMGERTIKQEIECFERFIETGETLTMDVDVKEGKIGWKLNSVKCGCMEANFLWENKNYVPFMEFCEVGLRISWKIKLC